MGIILARSGDSYTTTGFNAVQGPQPDATYPFGCPDDDLRTSSNGPNWVCFLTTEYNHSYIRTYNLAYGGATVASRLIHRFHPEFLSLEQQIEDVFIPLYAKLCTERGHPVDGDEAKTIATGEPTSSGAPTAADRWRPSSSLFAFFLGINDVGLSYVEEEPSVYEGYLATYGALVDHVYDAGARNFLFLTVPPVDRSPLTTRQGPDFSAKERIHIQRWNDGVAQLAANLCQRPGTTVFLYDAHGPFSRVIDDPAAFPETAGYHNTTGFCEAYAGGTDKPDSRLPECPHAVNQYLWLNDLHPTYPVHRLWARQIAEMLRTG